MMIDFEREIETKLDRFQALTGKGNVKDSNRTLYEIVRLMLGMINQREPRHPFNMHKHSPTKAAEPGEPIHADAVEATLEREETETDPEPSTEGWITVDEPILDCMTQQIVIGKDPKRPVRAPWGFTAAGNVRRDPNRSR